MKLKLLVLAAILLSVSYAYAESITTQQKEYWLGETVQAYVEMQGFELQKLSFIDNKSNKIPVGFLTQKIEGKDFVYFNIPLTAIPGKYYLSAKDRRVSNNTIQDFELSTSFDIAGNKGISIDPAIITLDPLKNEFKLSLKNNADNTLTVNITASEGLKPARDSIQLEPGTTKNAFISYTQPETEQEVTLKYLNRSHTIRILTQQKTTAENITTEPKEEPITISGELTFDGPATVDKKSSRYTSFSDPIKIKNTFQKDIKNVKFSLTGNLKDIAELRTQTIDLIAAGSEAEQYVWVNKNKNAPAGIYEGDLTAKSEEGYSDSIHLKITLEELTLVEEKPAEKPAQNLFNYSRTLTLINETKAQEEPNVAKNVMTALLMLLAAIIITFLIWRKMRVKTVTETLEEHVKTIKKPRK